MVLVPGTVSTSHSNGGRLRYARRPASSSRCASHGKHELRFHPDPLEVWFWFQELIPQYFLHIQILHNGTILLSSYFSVLVLGHVFPF